MQNQLRHCLWASCMVIAFGFQSALLYAEALPPKVLSPKAAIIKSLSDISVTDAVVYVPLGKSQTTIAFFTLHNNSEVPVAITKVTSRAIKKIVLVPAIPVASDVVNPWLVPGHQTLRLNPANQHLQLTGLKNSLSTGDELHLEVSLSNGKKLLLITRAKSAFDQVHGH
jgi:copper(I)-binding protein